MRILQGENIPRNFFFLRVVQCFGILHVVSPCLFDKNKTVEIHKLEIKQWKTDRFISIAYKNKSQLFTSVHGIARIFCSISGR